MGTFVKTFVVCFLLAIGYLAYRFIGDDSFSPTLKISDSNPVFSISKDKSRIDKAPVEDDIVPSKDITEPETEAAVPKKEINKKYTHNCYFYSPNGKLTLIKREVEAPLTLENTLYLLLKGPLISESKKGIYSEIPPNVDLINVQRKDDAIIVNLTSNFGNGGGSESIENRVAQLAKTVKTAQPGKKVYLYINGSEVEYLGGEGVYVKQPLE